MFVGVGYSDSPDTEAAGTQAARQALAHAGAAGQLRPCDLVLLFATSSHDPAYLRSVVASIVGEGAGIVGGGCVGAIGNDAFGYAGDQVILATCWLNTVACDLVAEGGLVDHEAEVGHRLGRELANDGVARDTPTMLFYDAVNRTGGDVRLNLATPLLQGIERGLGFLPTTLVGAGLQADYACSAGMQFIGAETVEQHAFTLTFKGPLRIDSLILHGCRPSGERYRVTKADRQTILEINGQPAIPFLRDELRGGVPVEAFPFYMIFGINRGAPGAPFAPEHYANRLCFGLDRARDGIVMFESDMVAGTEFQIMYRSLDLDYIAPKIDALFLDTTPRRPVFAFYIDCAGRAAKYGGEDLEDAVVVQEAVAGRVPLLGIYTGVEIAPIQDKPRTLDWTGVFCLFSLDE